ncbi:transmembrane protein 208 [Planococcus citri]|uniref:transmembrane protein 208 n=1 Tax=Planococcus citri TaxID=170843 RepID=UPI0031FA330E
MAAAKGKQATKGQKQIVAENKSTLQFYRNMALIANALYLVSGFFFFDILTFKQISLLVFSSSLYIGSYQFMASMAKTKYSAEGQLIDSGLDLNMEGGVSEHIKDLFILTAGCQVLSIYSSYFWLLWLLAPGRALWLAWVNFLGPYFQQQSAANQPPEVNEKKQKKLERRMKRQQNR